jgi:hypothetical protein
MNQTRSSRAPIIQRKLTARLTAVVIVVVVVCVVADIKV